ncbi:uncharacterized protein ZBIST_0628 [Zygosaccharomyces bailii]|nr:uncharacterized protein ZBIST_0628 [Zygosaccharomyces bailii]
MARLKYLPSKALRPGTLFLTFVRSADEIVQVLIILAVTKPTLIARIAVN